jgi:hypothetical protein
VEAVILILVFILLRWFQLHVVLVKARSKFSPLSLSLTVWEDSWPYNFANLFFLIRFAQRHRSAVFRLPDSPVSRASPIPAGRPDFSHLFFLPFGSVCTLERFCRSLFPSVLAQGRNTENMKLLLNDSHLEP